MWTVPVAQHPGELVGVVHGVGDHPLLAPEGIVRGLLLYVTVLVGHHPRRPQVVREQVVYRPDNDCTPSWSTVTSVPANGLSVA